MIYQNVGFYLVIPKMIIIIVSQLNLITFQLELFSNKSSASQANVGIQNNYIFPNTLFQGIQLTEKRQNRHLKIHKTILDYTTNDRTSYKLPTILKQGITVFTKLGKRSLHCTLSDVIIQGCIYM